MLLPIRQSISNVVVRELPLNTWQDACMLKLTGFAVKEFLQGYVTCNTDRINTDSCTPFAVCSLQGRVVTNGWAIELADGIGLVMHRSVHKLFRDYLKPYLQFSKCTLEEGEGFVHVATAADAIGVPFLPGWHLLLQDSTESPDNIDVSDDINEHLIEQRIVLLQQPCSAQHLPQMLGLEQLGAVDFDKGCYLGQEVVARAQFRGAVKRGLDVFDRAAASTVAVTLGQSLTLDGVKGDVVMIGAQQGLWVTRL